MRCSGGAIPSSPPARDRARPGCTAASAPRRAGRGDHGPAGIPSPAAVTGRGAAACGDSGRRLGTARSGVPRRRPLRTGRAGRPRPARRLGRGAGWPGRAPRAARRRGTGPPAAGGAERRPRRGLLPLHRAAPAGAGCSGGGITRPRRPRRRTESRRPARRPACRRDCPAWCAAAGCRPATTGSARA